MTSSVPHVCGTYISKLLHVFACTCILFVHMYGLYTCMFVHMYIHACMYTLLAKQVILSDIISCTYLYYTSKVYIGSLCNDMYPCITISKLNFHSTYPIVIFTYTHYSTGKLFCCEIIMVRTLPSILASIR